MPDVLLDNWEKFEAEVSRVLDDFEKRRDQRAGHVSDPLFRGQADMHWPLRTTLERFSPRAWTVREYFGVVRSVSRAIGSLTPRSWSLPTDQEIDESKQGPPPGYELMIYLRHHGFPSPLLDWSRSPYVAAFFAFASRPADGCEAVALYSFAEYLGEAKMWDSNKARIIGLGSYVVTHERHYAQQCEYTICKKPVDRGFVYASHDEGLQNRMSVQDSVTRYLIPVNQRRYFLKKLESMNVHAYSLFRDESALMHTLAYREIEKRDGV